MSVTIYKDLICQGDTTLEALTTNDSIVNYGNLQMLTDGSIFEIWTHDVDAIKIMSAGSNYSKLSFGVNTTIGYTYMQSVKDGSGTLLPISFWAGTLRAWDISTAGHLLSGGTGATVQNITTAGAGTFGSANTFVAGGAFGSFVATGSGRIDYGDIALTDNPSNIFFGDTVAGGSVIPYWTIKHALPKLSILSGDPAATTIELGTILSVTTANGNLDTTGTITAGTFVGATNYKSKQTEIDFGTTPVDEATFTITDTEVTTASDIIAQVAYVAPTGKELDELEFDTLDFRAVAGTGQFTLHVSSKEGYVADKFKVNYSYNKV